jgi:hypothetical protein
MHGVSKEFMMMSQKFPAVNSVSKRSPEDLALKMALLILIFMMSFALSSYASTEGSPEWPEYRSNPYKIKLNSSQHEISGRGGIIVSDLNDDGLLDFVVTTKEHDTGKGRAAIGAYDHFGEELWIVDDADIKLNGQAEYNGLPGWHGPGISASDVDNDGNTEIVHLNRGNKIVIRMGESGEIKKVIPVALPEEGIQSHMMNFYRVLKTSSVRTAIKELFRTPDRWAHFEIVNLKGRDDDEAILQADPLPFRWLKAISLRTGETLWENYQYVGPQHGGLRAADIDGDSFDEVVGGVVIDHNGKLLNTWQYRKFPGHFDSLYIGDILPEETGLEWVLLEEGHKGDDRTSLLGRRKPFFYHSFAGEEPQNAAIGEFDTLSPGMEIWCRSRFNTDQRPWVIDSSGRTIASYRLNNKKPDSWSDEGIEVIYRIDWYGGSRHYIAAKERHVDGKISIIDPLTGEFLHWWNENAARIYVADVAGDYREEIIVLNSKENEIRVYFNGEENSHKRQGRYWDLNEYKRQKLNYNYYSP